MERVQSNISSIGDTRNDVSSTDDVRGNNSPTDDARANVSPVDDIGNNSVSLVGDTEDNSVSSTRDTDVVQQESLYSVINRYYPGAVLGEIEVDGVSREDFGIVTYKDNKMLIYVKNINGEIAFYNMKISKNTFGPELIHEEDYKLLQQTMQRMRMDKCVYVIYSTDKDAYGYQHTFPLDNHYLEWITEEA